MALLLLVPMIVVGYTDCEECWDECYAFCTGPCGDDPPGGDCGVQGRMFTVLCLAFVCQQNACHSRPLRREIERSIAYKSTQPIR